MKRIGMSLGLLLSAVPLAASAGASALVQPASTTGGGTLTLGKDTYNFRIDSLNLAPAQPKLKLTRTFVLRGKLEPESGPALAFELTAMEDGRIYGLRIHRKLPSAGGEDSWGATLKTKVQVLELDARPGGKLRLSLGGPLTSVEGGKTGASSWKGELWGTFREVPL